MYIYISAVSISRRKRQPPQGSRNIGKLKNNRILKAEKKFEMGLQLWRIENNEFSFSTKI